jgi:orotidine-5'-phosphate decarboxylase
MRAAFHVLLEQSRKKNNSLLCVGLDPELVKLPAAVKSKPATIFEFNKAIIDATADLVCAYKPQIAYYAAARAEDQLEQTIHYIQNKYPHIPVILDAKRNDIGKTAEMYAEEAFTRYKADAVTVSPYMGGDTLEPFLKRADKGVVILCRTSNAGAKDLQDLQVDGKPLYQVVAQKAAKEWNKNKNVLLVIGATYPKELAQVRALVGDDITVLVPGIGAQGGDIEAAVKSGKNNRGTGLVINSSRAILYASEGPNFADEARKVAETTRDEINSYL